MMRHLNVSVLVPLVLSFAFCVLIFVYVSSRSQYQAALEDKRGIQRALSDLRSERDSLQYDLSNTKNELKLIAAEKEKALVEVDDAHAKVVRI